MSYQFINLLQTIKAQSNLGLFPNAAALISYLWVRVISIIGRRGAVDAVTSCPQSVSMVFIQCICGDISPQMQILHPANAMPLAPGIDSMTSKSLLNHTKIQMVTR